jgi:hypothetical protein
MAAMVDISLNYLANWEPNANTKYPNRWKKGVSGNPRGRPKTDVKVRELARQNTEAAIHALMNIVLNQKANPRTRMSAAKTILAYAWERPRHFAGEKKKSIRGYIDSLYALKWGFLKGDAHRIRQTDKKERELNAVIEPGEDVYDKDWSWL